MEAQKGDHKFLLYYSDQVTHAMILGNGSQIPPKASLLASTLKVTVTLTLVLNSGSRIFCQFPVNFDLTVSQVRRHPVLESPSPGVSDSLLAGVARPYRSHRDLDHRSTQMYGTYFFKFKFLVDICPFVEPLIPLFWTSGDISSGFQRQNG